MDAHKEQSISLLTLFYSYADADKDEELRNELEKHLNLLQRQRIIAGWHRHKIVPGSNKNQVSEEQLSSVQIILLLISPDFLASDACHTEMQRALQRHLANQAHVIPLLMRPVDWEQAPFAHLQVLPRDGRPVTIWSDRDLAFARLYPLAGQKRKGRVSFSRIKKKGIPMR
jgi:TIR domain